MRNVNSLRDLSCSDVRPYLLLSFFVLSLLFLLRHDVALAHFRLTIPSAENDNDNLTITHSLVTQEQYIILPTSKSQLPSVGKAITEDLKSDLDMPNFKTIGEPLNDSNWIDVPLENTEDEEECHHFAAGPSSKYYPEVLQKKVFSNSTRFVFIVGLEGSGHHLFRPILSECPTCQCPPRLPGFTLSKDSMREGFFGINSDRNKMKKFLSNFEKMMEYTFGDDSEYDEEYETQGSKDAFLVEKRVDSTTTIQIGKTHDNSNKGRKTTMKQPIHKRSTIEEYEPEYKKRTYFINTYCGRWGGGELSYPNFGGKCREWKFPDVRIMAEMFESVGADFRVLVITRNAIDVLLSTTVHRHFEKWESAARHYIKLMNEDIISAQINRIDQRFINCIDYDKLPHIPKSLGEFLGIDNYGFNFADKMHQFYHSSVSNNTRSEEEKYNVEKDYSKLYVELQNAIDKLKHICTKSDNLNE